MNRSKRSEQLAGAGIRLRSDSTGGRVPTHDVALGQPDLMVPPAMKAAVIRAIEADNNGYIRPAGETKIRDVLGVSLAQRHPALGEYKRDFDVVITSGATGALYCSILACCDPGDEILIPDPYFAPYVDLSRLSGVTPVFINTYPDFSITAARIREHITPRTRLLILNSPNNPTGHVISRQNLSEIISLCESAEIGIISDEIYGAFSYGLPHTSVADLTRSAIVVSGFAKSHGATGWRLGYAIVPTEVSAAVEAMQGAIYVSPPSIVHHAIPAALDTNSDDYAAIIESRRNAVVSLLKTHFPTTSCEGGIFVFFNVSEKCKCSASMFAEEVAANGVILVPGHVFSNLDTHCRMSLTRDLDYLVEAVDIILRTADSLSKSEGHFKLVDG